MTSRRLGRFEVVGWSDYLRTAAGSALLIVLGVPLLSSAVKALPHAASWHVQRWWARAVLRFLRIDVDLAGVEHVDPGGRYLVAPLHESFLDVPLLATLPLKLRFVARDELFEWRWLGMGLRATDQILVKPESRIDGLRTLIEEAWRTLERGRSLVMFPQGSLLGVEAAFRRGPFRIADRLGVQLLPVVITGSHRVWEHPFTDRLRFGQRVSLSILEPIPVGEAESRMLETARRMKSIALSEGSAPARRFDPERDGYWDGYDYEVDPEFPEIAELVQQHRARAGNVPGRQA